MFEDKTLICKDCGKSLFFLQESRSITNSTDYSMSLSVAKSVGKSVKAIWNSRKNYIRLFVNPVEKRHKFLLCRVREDQFTAMNAFSR